MKLKLIIPIFYILFSLTACSSDDVNDPVLNEIEGLSKVQEFSNDTHTIEVFNNSGSFSTGYNALSLRIKDNNSNNYIENAQLSWNPMMKMDMMEHSAPKSSITKAPNKTTVYEGYIIFQMTELDGSGWSLNFNYTINDIAYSASYEIKVLQTSTQNVSSFKGADNLNYVMAFIGPNKPKIGVNKLEVALYQMVNMMEFKEVTNYKITLDPRMPGMGNHSSPNNTDLLYNTVDKIYQADLSLTMTGYWVLNLKLYNAAGELLKGEDVTPEHLKSTLNLELDF